MNWALLSGVFAVGLAAGLAPGPTATLVITQTLRFGLWEGTKVALSPLITDVPIMCIALFTVNHFSHIPVAFGVVSLIGAIFLLYLAKDIFSSPLPAIEEGSSGSRSLTKGVLTNLLNPGPYLFWGTVGTPMLLNASKVNYSTGVTVAALFLSMIVGGKFIIAITAKYFSNFLRGEGYFWLLRTLSVVMLFYALFYLKDAGNRFGLF